MIGFSFLVSSILADTISISGVITQSTQDGTGPAVNNPSLNQIADGDSFTLLLKFSGAITSPGIYALPVAMLVFSDPAATASESAFGTFPCAGQNTSACVTVAADGPSYDFSMLACLTTGSGCLTGNELDLNFKIGRLNGQNVGAQAIAGLVPLELLEDDGVTDIHASVTTYSYTGDAGLNPAPEPAAWLLLAPLIPWMVSELRRRPNRTPTRFNS